MAPGACPIVQLGTKLIRSRSFGDVPRPHFEIIGWTGGSTPVEVLPPAAPATPALPAPEAEAKPKRVGALAGRADMDDEIPF
jgi:hypothetical protein